MVWVSDPWFESQTLDPEVISVASLEQLLSQYTRETRYSTGCDCSGITLSLHPAAWQWRKFFDLKGHCLQVRSGLSSFLHLPYVVTHGQAFEQNCGDTSLQTLNSQTTGIYLANKTAAYMLYHDIDINHSIHIDIHIESYNKSIQFNTYVSSGFNGVSCTCCSYWFVTWPGSWSRSPKGPYLQRCIEGISAAACSSYSLGF